MVHEGKLSLEEADSIVDRRDAGEIVDTPNTEPPPKQVVLLDVVKLEFSGRVVIFFDKNGDRVVVNGSPEMPKLAQDALTEQLAAFSEQVKASTQGGCEMNGNLYYDDCGLVLPMLQANKL